MNRNQQIILAASAASLMAFTAFALESSSTSTEETKVKTHVTTSPDNTVKSELHAPTIAQAVPTRLSNQTSFSGIERS